MHPCVSRTRACFSAVGDMSKPTIGLRVRERRFEFEECDMKVAADGYVIVGTPIGRFRELLLTFAEVQAALQEERDLWK